MAEVLIESGKRASRTGVETALRKWSSQKRDENIAAMRKLCEEIITERINNPEPDNNDLLNTMLNVADPVTGQKLDHDNIGANMVTFLIAGHETTSGITQNHFSPGAAANHNGTNARPLGTLSYLFYNLLKHPETFHKAQQEVDQVLGDAALEVGHLSKFKYLDACIKETLRVNGPIGITTRHAKKDTVLVGKYQISSADSVVTNLAGLHKDPAVWGDDAEEFRPERMLDPSKVPSDAWKPFGMGIRGCIGRAFAEQEMLINVALILQRFQVEMADPSYELGKSD